MVYSPLASLKIAKKNPDKQVVFLGLGFETTAPSSAMTVLQAAKEQVYNFSLFCNHITIIPALKAMLDSPDLKLDGFVGPGHVSTVIGTSCYDFVPRDYGRYRRSKSGTSGHRGHAYRIRRHAYRRYAGGRTVATYLLTANSRSIF